MDLYEKACGMDIFFGFFSKNDIPSDIVGLILSFYHIVLFAFEYHSNKIKLEENKITNISGSSLQIVVVGDWIDPEIKKIHTVKIKIIRQTGCIGIGIVPVGYRVDEALIYQQGGYNQFNTDFKNNTDIFTATFDCNTLKLSYHLSLNDGEEKSGLFRKGSVEKANYFKWAVTMYSKNDVCTIIEVN